MHKPGYREMFVRSADWHGTRIKPHTRMFLRLAPPEREDAVLAFATQTGKDIYQTASSVVEVRASSNGAMFFGAGLAGMAGAVLASRIDQMLAGWDIRFSGPPGHIHLYSQCGPPPSEAELSLVEHRLDQARYVTVDHGAPLDDEEEEEVRRNGVGTNIADSTAEGMRRAVLDTMYGRLAGHPMPLVEYETLQDYITTAANESWEGLVVAFADRQFEVGRTQAYMAWATMTCFYLPDDEAQDVVEGWWRSLRDLYDDIVDFNS
jgi:hypothetical protein